MREMFKIFFMVFLISFVGLSYAENPPRDVAESRIDKVSRKEQLLLEGVINDHIHRIKVKRVVPYNHEFEAYASVLPDSINIYVYPVSDSEAVRADFPVLEKFLKDGVQSTILNFDDYDWARKYKFDVILRINDEYLYKD